MNYLHYVLQRSIKLYNKIYHFFFIKKKDCLHQKVCWVGNGYQSAILNWILCTITPLMFWKDLSKFYIFTLTKRFSLKLELKWTPVYHFKLCEFAFFMRTILLMSWTYLQRCKIYQHAYTQSLFTVMIDRP